jgi:hypothetical protein
MIGIKLRIMLAASIVACAFVPACADPIVQTHKVNSEPIDVVGEVVDTWCYASKSVGDGRGPAHKKCAEVCIQGGVSAGIVDEKGNLYVAAKTKAYTGANRMLLPFVAKKVVAHGWVSRAGGCQLLKIDSVEEWKPGMKIGRGKSGSGPDPKDVDMVVKRLLQKSDESKTVYRNSNPSKSK